VIQGAAEGALWQQVKEFEWVPAGWPLVKVPLTPKRIPTIEAQLNGVEARRYSAGGNVLWLAWPTANAEVWSSKLNSLLHHLPGGSNRLWIQAGGFWNYKYSKRVIGNW
jgi:hypothetical protein